MKEKQVLNRFFNEVVSVRSERSVFPHEVLHSSLASLSTRPICPKNLMI
jgi:hypothetical protein